MSSGVLHPIEYSQSSHPFREGALTTVRLPGSYEYGPYEIIGQYRFGDKAKMGIFNWPREWFRPGQPGRMIGTKLSEDGQSNLIIEFPEDISVEQAEEYERLMTSATDWIKLSTLPEIITYSRQRNRD